MMNYVITANDLMFSTVRIKAQTPNGTYYGTGTVFGYNVEGWLSIVLATNKHVIRDSFSCTLEFTARMNTFPAIGQRMNIPVPGDGDSWIHHESEDIAILPLDKILAQYSPYVTPIFETLIPNPIATFPLFPCEDIIMIGYPNTIADEVNNLPIFRKGITATSPQFNFNGRREFLIDIAVINGSSSSPVFIFDEGSYTDHAGGIYQGNRLIFLGILYAGFECTRDGTVKVIHVPVSERVVSSTSIPINLGCVVKSECLLDLKLPLMNKIAQPLPPFSG